MGSDDRKGQCAPFKNATDKLAVIPLKETILKKPIINDDLQEAENKATMHKDMVRERLLDKAADLFIRRGYSNTRLQDIAEELLRLP